MYTRGERLGQAIVLVAGLVFALAVGGFILRGGPGGEPGRGPTTTASATAAPKAPDVKFAHDTCCTQTARYLHASWDSSLTVLKADLQLAPDPGFPCATTLDPGALKGVITCQGLLRGATDYVAALSLTVGREIFRVEHKFRTMGDRLTDVKWFSEFENPTGDPLACAAASVRIVQNYTAKADAMTAEQILSTGKAYNKSRDPGLDPVAIATIQKRLDARNNYHYYRFGSREEATKSAVYWLFRSGKPVHVISLAGQHDPLLIGFVGAFGTFYDDPINKIDQVVVEDPQRGDMRPETLSRRPDKYRTPGFQTGQPLGLDEWYRDEWWLGFTYTCCLQGVNIDRNDGAYATPHWAGTFVLLVDDADADWPPDREGRVKWH
ncbi:MAG TPA: hypothetical protein VGQ86_02875 [Candidatus Limnocylindria bacterium]|nr:hypothetical protein [Candidatus Limnocylindria bacterium]